MKVGNVALGVIKAIIREKSGAINRPQLGDVNGSEIKVLDLSRLQSDTVYICRVRGMTYRVETSLDHPSIAIFDPQTVCTGKGCHLKKSPTYLSL